MKLLFIRHGDPDYANDTITDKGKVEAKLLAKYLKNQLSYGSSQLHKIILSRNISR